MDITGFAKGLTQIGQYALARKQQDFKTKNMFALEQLKNEMWKRKLQQQAEQAEAQRQFLLKKYEFDTQAKMEKEKADLAKWNRLKDIEEGHFRETKKLEGIRALTEQNRSRAELVRTQKEKDQTLTEIRDILKSASPEYTKNEEGQTIPIKGTGNKQVYDEAMKMLRKYGEEKLGFTKPQEPNVVNKLTYPGMLNPSWMQPNPWLQPSLPPKKNEGDVFELGL